MQWDRIGVPRKVPDNDMSLWELMTSKKKGGKGEKAEGESGKGVKGKGGSSAEPPTSVTKAAPKCVLCGANDQNLIVCVKEGCDRLMCNPADTSADYEHCSDAVQKDEEGYMCTECGQ